MKTALILLALATGIPALTGCSSDSGGAKVTPPPPQDSGVGDGSPEKIRGKQEKVGGRTIPGAK